MKRISDWAKVLLPLVGSGMVLHYLFLWHERRHAVALHKEVYSQFGEKRIYSAIKTKGKRTGYFLPGRCYASTSP